MADSGHAASPPAADAAAPPRPSAAAIYARILPLLALGLVAWLVAADVVLEHEGRGRDPIRVAWGFRTLSSAEGRLDSELLVVGYGEAADRIAAHVDAAAEPGATDPRARAKARDTEAAYRSLHVRGWMSLVVLVIGGVLFLVGGLGRGLGIAQRAGFHLLGSGAVLVGVLWFRWCFTQVRASIAYAGEGEYGYTAPTLLVLLGLLATSLVFLALRRQGRPASDG